MYSLKGFVSLLGFANNVVGETAAIGELSAYSKTFSREVGLYNRPTMDTFDLFSFQSIENNVLVPIPTGKQDVIFNTTNWIVGRILSNEYLNDRTEFLNELLMQYSATIEDVDCGAILSANGSLAPEWVSFKIKNEESFIRLWFVDQAFQTQYDEYEIIIVPAMDNLNDFFRPYTDVAARLDDMTTTVMVNKLQDAKDGYPDTVIKVETFDYINPSNNLQTLITKWGILIYGAAGNNVDSIKDALIEFILANSTHSREEWTGILPDIFKRTEFILVPLWNQYAIPNRTLEAGIYSPFAKVPNVLPIAQFMCHDYDPIWVESNLTIMGHPYRSLSVLLVPNVDNRVGAKEILDLYPDYIAVSTGADFNRMEPDTQDWSYAIAEMIYIAESLNVHTQLSSGYTRTKRGGLTYLVKTMKNTQFLVVAKNSFDEYNPSLEPDEEYDPDSI